MRWWAATERSCGIGASTCGDLPCVMRALRLDLRCVMPASRRGAPSWRRGDHAPAARRRWRWPEMVPRRHRRGWARCCLVVRARTLASRATLLTSFSRHRPQEVRATLLPSVYPSRCSRGGLHRHHRRRRASGCLRRTTLDPRQTSALPLHQCGKMSDLASSCPSSSAWTTRRRPRLVAVCEQSCAAGRFESPT